MCIKNNSLINSNDFFGSKLKNNNILCLDLFRLSNTQQGLKRLGLRMGFIIEQEYNPLLDFFSLLKYNVSDIIITSALYIQLFDQFISKKSSCDFMKLSHHYINKSSSS